MSIFSRIITLSLLVVLAITLLSGSQTATFGQISVAIPAVKPKPTPAKTVPKSKTPTQDWAKPEAERAAEVVTEAQTDLTVAAPTEQLFTKAFALIKANKLDEARAVFLEAEKLEPNMFAVQMNLGSLSAILKKMPEAVSALQKAVTIAPKSAKAHGYLCQAFFESDRRIEAADECREAVRLDPDDDRFNVLLALLYAADERQAEALRILVALYARSQDDIFVLGALGDVYYDNGDYARAAEIYEKIAVRWPTAGIVYLRLSNTYSFLNRPTESIAAARKFYELYPKVYLAQINLGKVLQEAGFFDESIEYLLKATGTDPANGDAYMLLSESYEAIGEKDKALGSVRHAYKYLPASPKVALRLGKALTAYGKMAEAVNPLEQANELEPNQLEVMGLLGLACFESNEFDKAIEILSKADQISPNPTISIFLQVANGRKQMLGSFEQILDYVRKNPTDANARTQLASVYRYKGMLKEAEVEYQEIIKANPGEVSAYSQLGIFYSDTGQTEKAIIPYQKAAELSNHHVAYLNLASALEKLGKLDEAIATGKKSVEINGTLMESRILLGDLLLKKGNREEALREFQAAYDLSPGNPAPNFRLAWYFLRLRNKEGALRYYNNLRGVEPTQLLYLERALKAYFGPQR